jgi:hypothetical protein
VGVGFYRSYSEYEKSCTVRTLSLYLVVEFSKSRPSVEFKRYDKNSPHDKCNWFQLINLSFIVLFKLNIYLQFYMVMITVSASNLEQLERCLSLVLVVVDPELVSGM